MPVDLLSDDSPKDLLAGSYPSENKGFTAGDYLKGLKKGALEIPGSLTGLADTLIAAVTGRKIAGPIAESLGKGTGLEFGKRAKETSETLSPGAKAGQAKINEAWKASGADRLGNALLGNFEDLPEAWRDANLSSAGKAILENPGASLMQVAESVPGTLAGGAIGRGVAVAGKVAPWLAGGIGEGAISAGQQMDQTPDTVNPRKAALTSLASGLGTGAIGAVGGRLAGKFGFDDLQTAMAGGAAGSRTKLLPRIVGGAIAEAAEELPQSTQETVWRNFAEDKPLGEGAIRSGVEGMISGGVMGSVAGSRPRGSAPTDTDNTGANTPTGTDIAGSDAANAELGRALDAYANVGTTPLLEEKPIIVQNPTTGSITELDRRAGPLEAAAAHAVESGLTSIAQNVNAGEVLQPFQNLQAAQGYVQMQADPEMFDIIPHPRVAGTHAVVPKTGAPRQEILDKRSAASANQAAELRAAQLKQDESHDETWITEKIKGRFGDGGAGTVTLTPRNDGGFDVNVVSQSGSTKRTSHASFAGGVSKTDAIKQATAAHGGFTSDKTAPTKPKPVIDTSVEDAAQDELAPKPVQKVADMPGVQQKVKTQAKEAVSKARVRAEQLASEETPETIDAQAQAANPAPTEGQKKAGNYAHGHLSVSGLDISIETPAGAIRTGRDGAKSWKVKNTAHYGYVKRTNGADGEQIDVYVKPGTAATHDGQIFVVDQYNPATGSFDEHKAMIGYGNAAEAAKAYDAHFSDKSGAKRRGAVAAMTTSGFKAWLKNGDTSRPVSSKKFNGQASDPAQEAQDEIAQSTGARFSLPRSAQMPGESDADFLLRRAAATHAKKLSGTATQNKLPTREGDQAAVRKALQQPDDAPVLILSAESRPDAGRAKGISKQAAQFIEQVARLFGKRVVFFDVPERNAAEGFYQQGNTIYLNVNSSTQHLRVLGHELTHAMKAQAGDAYQKMLAAVAMLRTDAEMMAQYHDYYRETLSDAKLLDQPHEGGPQTLREFLAEEWMADLSGNRFAESQFWTDVFTQLESQHGTKNAKGIIARVRLALVAALNKIRALIGGNAFAVDERLGEHLDEIRKAVATGFAEYARLAKEGRLSESTGTETKLSKTAFVEAVPSENTSKTKIEATRSVKPGSDIGHKRESDGRYVGSPDWVGSSPRQLAILRKKLRLLALDGEPGRFWYERSSKAILDLVNGDKAEAERFVQLIAIYSPSNVVPANTTMAVKAYYQWKQGLPIKVGTTNNDKKANDVLYNGTDWSGVKTNSFYSNLMQEIDPSKNDTGQATMDMWMSLAFDYGRKDLDQGPKYYFSEREIQRLAKELGWTPHQAQAAIWTAMKGRIDPIRGDIVARELDNGWHNEETQKWWAGERDKYLARRNAVLAERAKGSRVAFPTIKEAGVGTLKKEHLHDHYHLAHEMGMAYDLRKEDVEASKFDFSDAINERTAQMSWEATPGKTTGVLPGIHDAPMHQQQEYLAAIRAALTDDKGNNIIGKVVGVALAKSTKGFSGWQGVTTIGVQDGIVIPPNSQEGGVVQKPGRDALNLVADILGMVLKQEGVAWHYPIFTGSKGAQNGIEFTIGRLLTEVESAKLYDALSEKLGHSFAPPIPTQDGQGFRVLNFPDEKFDLMGNFSNSAEDVQRKKALQKAQLAKNTEFAETVYAVVYDQPWHSEISDNARFETDGELRENDWSNGDDEFRRRIAQAASGWSPAANRWAGRSDIFEWIDSDLIPKVEAVNRDFAKRYGWDTLRAGTANERGIKYSPDRRADSPRGGYVGSESGRADSGPGGPVSGQSARKQDGQVNVTGVHFSKEPRTWLSGVYFGKGTGAKSQEAERVFAATDERIKSRIYAYVSEGKGVFPEDDVGRHAHKVVFDNLYDASADPLDFWVKYRDANTRESAVLDAGFDGYYARGVFGNQGVAILMGKAATRGIAPDYRGTEYRGKELDILPIGEASQFGKQQQAIAANRSLPDGEMKGADWKRLMPRLMPDIDVSHLDDNQKYYKNEIAKRPAKLSPARLAMQWDSQTTNEIGPVYKGKGFELHAVRKLDTETDFPEQDALPWGHAAFVRDPAYRFAILDRAGNSAGFLDAEVNGLDEINAIHDMAIEHPGEGLGAKVVETIMASTYDGVRVIDVLPQSERFWDRLGAGNYDIYKNTTLDFEGSPAEARFRHAGSARVRSEAKTGTSGQSQEVRFSTPRYDGLPESATRARPLDDTGLRALRRSAAKLERPKDGIFLHITDDGKAIATGPKGARIPNIFRRFAHENGLSFFAERRIPANGDPVYGQSGITPKTEPMPIAYRETGALYFGESGGEALDRTGNTRFSEKRLAPNGKPSNLNEAQWHQVRTPAFKAWFGDWEAVHNGEDGNGVWAHEDVSKVVDENGEPRVVYHGTQQGGFRAFDPYLADKHRSPMIFSAGTRNTARTYSGRGDEIELPPIPTTFEGFEDIGYEFEEEDGNYWVLSPDGYTLAEDVSQEEALNAARTDVIENENEDRKSGIYSLYLNIRNPNESDFEGANWDGAPGYDQYEVWNIEDDERVYDEDGRGVFSEDEAIALAESLGDDTHEVREASDRFETTNSVAEDAKLYGNDGAIIRNTVDSGGRGGYADIDDVFVFFDPNQAKSATQNTGTFSLINNDLRYSPPRFISQLTQAIEQAPAKMQTQPAQLWKLWLVNRSAINKDELMESGVLDWLDLQDRAKIDRKQIQTYLRDNEVTLTDKVSSERMLRFSHPRLDTLGTLTPAQEAAAIHVLGAPKTFTQRLAEFKKDWAKNLKQGIFDQFAPISELDQNAYIQARLSKGGESSLEALMLYGKLFVGADGATDVRYTKAGKPQGFASKMAELKGEHDRFFLWVAAQRADRLKAIGLENLFSDTDIAVLKTLNQGAMKDGTGRELVYAKALQDLNDFNDNVLQIAVDSGLIDDATRQMYKDTPYIPFYRLQENDEVSGFGITPGLVNQYAWKKLKGGTQKLNEDLMANMLHNWSHLITASAKNRAAKATLDAAAVAGVAVQIPAGMPGKGHVSYKTGGKEQVFVVSDPHLMDAVAALHYAGLGPWAKPLSTAKHWLTVGVTANPAFKLRNLIRDSIGALGTADLSYNAAGNIAQGWRATAEDSETRAHLLASGGMIRFGSMLDGKDSQRAQDLIKAGVDPNMILDSDAKIKRFWKRFVSPAITAYNELGDRTEQVNRAALYEQLIAKGLTHAEAAYWARDLMDFSMSGKWTAIRTLTQTVPFFNARLQGLYKLGRAGKQDIRRLGTVLGAVTLSSLALLLAHQDDDDWKKRGDSDRNNYWWFKVGGHAFRLPKPFEIGAVGTLAERSYELAFNPEMTGDRFGKNMRDIVMSQLSMNPVPQLFKPMMDIYANRDSFTGQAIESMGMERLRKQDRFDEKTSETAKFLGSLGLPDPTQLVMGRWETLSPKQVDFLAKGYFSWLATMASTALDYGIRPMIENGDRPAMQLKDVFFVGNFVESLPSNSSRYLTQMYDQAREIEQAYASYHAKLKVGDVDGAKKILADDGHLIRRQKATEALKRQIGLLNTRLQFINASTRLTSDEKRIQLDKVYARRNAIAERFQVH